MTTYVTPQTQVLPLYVVAFKHTTTGVWMKHARTYHIEYAESYRDALINGPRYGKSNVKLLTVTPDLDEYVDEAMRALNGK